MVWVVVVVVKERMDERRGMVEERRKGEGEVEGMKAMEKIYIRSILGKARKASEGE